MKDGNGFLLGMNGSGGSIAILPPSCGFRIPSHDKLTFIWRRCEFTSILDFDLVGSTFPKLPRTMQGSTLRLARGRALGWVGRGRGFVSLFEDAGCLSLSLLDLTT